MNYWKWVAIVLTVLALGGTVALAVIPAPEKPPAQAGIPDLISVGAPLSGAAVASPLVVSGSARGNWYFEASFPVKLLDAAGAVIAQTPAQAHPPAGGDWMTTDFVPFSATLTFPAQPPGSRGMLVLHNDNPSGDPAHDRELDIPVVFK